MSGLYDVLRGVREIVNKGLRKFRFRQLAAFVLCAALLMNTVSIDALAAYDATLLLKQEPQDAEVVPDGKADGEAPDLESVSGGDLSEESAEQEDSQNSFESVSGGDHQDSVAGPVMSDTVVQPDMAAQPDAGMEPSMAASMEMSAPYAALAEEKLELKVTWPDNSYDGSKTLTLRKGQMSFSISPSLSGSTVNEPVLKIQIPSCMNVTYYPNENNTYLKEWLVASDPVSMTEDSSKNTILTYRFLPNRSFVGFSVNAEIPSGFQVKSGETYSIRLDYYDGTSFLKSEEKRFTTKNPTMEMGGIWLESAPNTTQTLQEGIATYDVSHFWDIYAISGHYPYTSLKMIVPLPVGAVPGLAGSGVSFTALRDGVSQTLSSSSGSYKLTYRSSYSYQSDDGTAKGTAGALIYEIPAGETFLASGSSFAFHSYSLSPYLRFTNPQAKTYQSAASPRIECVVDGQTIVMQDHTTSSYLTTVTFKELIGWAMVRPDNTWSDIVYLKEGVSVYDTNVYFRQIYASPLDHAAYDSLKMTVPLPEGATPGFGTGSSFTALESGRDYENGSFWVTYYENGSYSSVDKSICGTANLLVYEIRSGGFLESGLSAFLFSGPQQLHLRFTNPEAGEHKSAVSPKIEVTLKGQTTTKYDFNRTSYLTTVTFVEPPEESGVYPDFVENESKGWSDTITVEKDKAEYYYTRVYNRIVYSPVPHYPYDLVRMTVLLPDEAMPGFGNGEDFTALEDGKTYSKQSFSGNWKVTYHEQYEYANEEGTVSGIAQALVYELASAYSSADFLKSSSTMRFFIFGASNTSDRLYLRFKDPELKTYSSAASPKVECVMDGRLYVSAGYFSQTNLDTSVTFEGPKTDWSRFTVSGSTNATSCDLGEICVLPEEYQTDKEYYGHIKNNTGYTLENVVISYTFDEGLNVNKLELNLGGDGYPANAEITYTTRAKGTEKTVRLDAADNELVLEMGDAFLKAVITYDALESSADSKKILTASMHNYERKTETVDRNITAVPVSAGSELDSSDENTFDGRQPSSSRFHLFSTYEGLTAVAISEPKELYKGEEGKDVLNVKVITLSSWKYQNLRLYLRMPKGYILTGYVPPEEYKDGVYKVTNRILEGGDVLYCLEYTDDILYDKGDHIFSFRVGPEADTAQSKEIHLPTEIYAATEEGKLFQFQTNYKEETGKLDVNGDGDMEDGFYKLWATSSTLIKINPLSLIAIDGYLSVEGQAGEDLNNEYSCNSTGSYRYYLYNGAGSGASVTSGTVMITLHKAGDVLNYKDKDYSSQYDVLLTGPIEPQGDFLEGCSIEYSTDGKNWFVGEKVEDYTRVSYVRVQTAQDKILNSTESAYLNFPFAVDFPDNGTVGDKGYIDIQTEYTLADAGNPTIDYRINELSAKPVEFNGTIYQDRNCNGRRDADEISNDRTYTLKLYAGEGTDGTLLQEITTDPDRGNYSFGILLPGTYTLHVEKGEDEYYGASEYFDENGTYTFVLDKNVPATKGLDMGILILDIQKPRFSAVPDAPDGKDGWYVTLPQISLDPVMTEPYVSTMFWHDEGTAQKLTAETQPAVGKTGEFSFKAYNEIVWENGTTVVKSDTAALDLKVDVDKPTLREEFAYSIADGAGQNTGGNFLPFGNFFNKALRITIMAEDVGSGVAALYYTLPGEQTQSVQPDKDGYFQFDIPMNTAGRITYYVEDKAGNASTVTTLQKEGGSDIWVIEDRGPVWEEFVLTDINGKTGVQGADGRLWFTGTVNVSARVTDEDSGLAFISSRVNEDSMKVQEFTGNEKLTAFDFSTEVEAEGANLLWAEAADNAGNVSETRTAFGIDRIAPVIVLEEKTLTGDIPTATVLIRDTGSGVNPDSIHVLWQGEEAERQIAAADGGYRLTFSIAKMGRARSEAAFLVTAEDYAGWSTELTVTRYQRDIIYVAAFTGSDVTGDGCIEHPLQTLEAALERVVPGGMIVLLEDYAGTAYVNIEVTLDLNGQELHADVPGSAVTVGSLGILTIKDSNGSMSGPAIGLRSEGEVFGGIPGDPAFTLEEGELYLTDGTIYCGCVGSGSVEVMEDARMMYLLTYLSGGGTGENPGLHYIEENTTDELMQNTFVRDGYAFQGWLYEDHLYNPGQKILMPGRNMETLAKWAITEEEPEPEERGNIDQVPKTGGGKAGRADGLRTDHLELYIKIRKKEDEQSTED